MFSIKKQLRLLIGLVLSFVVSGAVAGPIKAEIEFAQGEFKKNERVMVKLKLTNTTSSNVGVLKYKMPKSEGDWEDDLFKITLEGMPVAYKGRHVKRSAPTKADYRILKPGQQIVLNADLADGYDFSGTGSYKVAYNAKGFGLTMSNAGRAQMASSAKDTFVWGREYVRPSKRQFARGGNGGGGGGDCKKNCEEPTPGFLSCDATQQAELVQAEADAIVLADVAYDYLRSASNDAGRYAHWFGAYDAARWDSVETDFAAIGNALQTADMEYDCGCKGNYYAHVYPDEPYTVYLCRSFWAAPALGTDSKAGVLIHEVSHFTVVAGTDDFVYGQAGAHDLANDNPDEAIKNADNMEYFAENTPNID